MQRYHLTTSPAASHVNEAKNGTKAGDGSALLVLVLPAILSEAAMSSLPTSCPSSDQLHDLNHISCRSSLAIGRSPLIQFYRFRDKFPVRPGQFVVFGHTEWEPLLVLLYIDNRIRIDYKAVRVRDFLKTVVERPEAPDLLKRHLKSVMFVVEGDVY